MRKLKFVTIPEDYFQYIDTVDYKCFLDQCEEVVKKRTNKKKASYLHIMHDRNVDGLQMFSKVY